MSSSHYALHNKPGHLAERHKLHGIVCITLVANVLLSKAPEWVILSVNQTLLKQPGVLVRPYYPPTPRSAVSESKHTDIEGMDELEVSSSRFRAIFNHPLRLSPFLKSLDGYKLGRDNGLKEQNSLMQPAE